MSNERLERNVKDELLWDPKIDQSAIAVSTDKSGVVTLRGTVGSPRQKREAQHAAERVYGVTRVVNELEVRILVGDRQEDADLRGAVLQALMLDSQVPATIDAHVKDGVVTLTGRARWNWERDEAEFIAGNVRGVRGVRSEIVLDATPSAAGVQHAIERALGRNARLAASGLEVEAANGTVILSGYVASWLDHDAAVATAWSMPGVTRVDDHIVVAS
jgi:osmotically-inducible protein OsmY